jgi:divalent metal cation (Fe/Co/Zn/Cd) transporter
VRKHPDVNYVNEILTMHMGPDFILLNLSLDFNDGALAPALEFAIAEMDAEIKQAFPEVKRIFIEAEPRPPEKTVPSSPGQASAAAGDAEGQ